MIQLKLQKMHTEVFTEMLDAEESKDQPEVD